MRSPAPFAFRLLRLLTRRPEFRVAAPVAGLCIALAATAWLAAGDAAAAHLDLHRFELAAEVLAERIDEDPDHAAAHADLARARAGLGEHAAALESIERAIALAPPGRAEWRRLRGALLARGGHTGPAVAEFDAAADSSPESRLRLALALADHQRQADAAAVLRAVLAEHPDHHRSRAVLAVLHASGAAGLDDPEQAWSLCVTALDADRGRTPLVAWAVARVAHALGRDAECARRVRAFAAGAGVADEVRARLVAIARALEHDGGG